MMERAGHRHEALQRNEGSSVRLEEPGHQPSISLVGILAALAAPFVFFVTIVLIITVVIIILVFASCVPFFTELIAKGCCAAIGFNAFIEVCSDSASTLHEPKVGAAICERSSPANRLMGLDADCISAKAESHDSGELCEHDFFVCFVCYYSSKKSCEVFNRARCYVDEHVDGKPIISSLIPLLRY